MLKNIYELMTTGDGVKVKDSENGNALQNLANTLSNQQQDTAAQTSNIVMQLLAALNNNPAGIPINIRTLGASETYLPTKDGITVIPIMER